MFSDRCDEVIKKTNSVLLAGCDPVLDALPPFLLESAATKSESDAEYVRFVLDSFSDVFISAIAGKVPAVKPNIAFFEQYGSSGIASFARFCLQARAVGLLVIADAKRGDIGSTAEAYARAFFGGAKVRGSEFEGFAVDALTVNPFLGFDTLEPFLKVAEERGKGIYVLVQTSNPGAKDIEGLAAEGRTVSERIADWVAENGPRLTGKSGWSGLGAVVGATYPQDAVELRKRMPRNLFLIPGYGAQGGSAKDATASFRKLPTDSVSGGLVNASRALLKGKAGSIDELHDLIGGNLEKLNLDLNAALAN